ncbi:MAG TPA: YHS domain-containing (seleno)protein [Thermoanaerobaculia bacterium]|nr:YHS domain-containing (seleno)protein [Thermoanaerobaculia bacterium]
MNSKKLKLALSLALLLGLASALLAPASAAPSSARVLINKDRKDVALQGYDPVAYFTDGKPAKGNERFQSQFGGGTYYFASAEHKATFDADPPHYAPQYGGYCGYAASVNRLSPIDPKFFQVIEGRLILQHNQKALDLFNKDLPGNIQKADANWPGLVQKNGVAGKVLVNVDGNGVAIEGYDAVAYFTDGKPVKGDPTIQASFNGALYHFVSQEHREIFERDPTHYAPAFGGYCAYAASINKISPIDPTIFQILNDRLVLQHTPKAYELFNQAPQANLAKADQNWPGLTEKNGH